MGINIISALTRKKTNTQDTGSQLARVLGLVDLTALGVGATLGLGLYVLAGSVAKTVAGPAVCLSFLVAAIASAVAALCYAEFAARVSKAGSAYIYSYICMGEFIAFVIGWVLILEYVIGSASVARGLSNYIDALTGRQIRDALRDYMPMEVSFLSPYPDFLAFGFILLLTSLLAFGVRESALLATIFTVLNLITISIVIVAGSIRADVNNWKIPVEDIPEEYRPDAGTGGFLPFGWAGVMAGAARCFFGFVGFDVVPTTSEEAKNPRRDIPLSILISIGITFAAYFGISTVMTMAWPYYLQDADAPFPHLFEQLGWDAIKWIVTVGAIFALCTTMLGALLPLPRIIYAMANDGLLFKFLCKVHARTKTPLIATLLSGLLAGIMAALFNLDQLVELMSIATLLAYTIVAVCVLVLRYEVDESSICPDLEITINKEQTVQRSTYENFKVIFNLGNNKIPTTGTSKVVNWSIVLFTIFSTVLCAILVYGQGVLFTNPYYLSAFIISIVAMILFLIIMIRQPMADVELYFKVPLVPYIPCISVIFNLYLMMELDLDTWIKFLVWLVIGILIYFFYGVPYSEENQARKKINNTSSDEDITKF